MENYIYDLSGNLSQATISKIVAPLIISQPASSIAAIGEDATFSVDVEDTNGATFQWIFEGADISGANGDSIIINNVTAANKGRYSVVVSNSIGSVTSADAELLLDTDGDELPDNFELIN